DEARVGQKGRTGYVWWQRSETPRGLRDVGFQSAWIIGIVSRSNLTQALASAAGRIDHHDETDRQIRLEALFRLREQSWTDFGSRNIPVSDGVLHLWVSSARRQNERRCWRLPKSYPASCGFPTK